VPDTRMNPDPHPIRNIKDARSKKNATRCIELKSNLSSCRAIP
jgi:hypothetical protein